MSSAEQPVPGVRPPLGGWPKSIYLQEGESYVKWDGALHDQFELLEQSDIAGTLYLTNRRLFFNPMFLVFRKIRVWSLPEISALGNDSRPGFWRHVFSFSWMSPWDWPFYIDAKNERHYFHTTRDDEWLITLGEATGLKPRWRNA